MDMQRITLGLWIPVALAVTGIVAVLGWLIIAPH
jgi:hypothetical protein